MSAALQAKTKEINGVFKCVCIADVDSGADGARKYADVKEQKERQALTDPNAYGVWGYGKVGDVMYSGSAFGLCPDRLHRRGQRRHPQQPQQ